MFWKSCRRKNKHRNNEYKLTVLFVTMFREQDMFDRELFVDSTRSVSVVLGEKDNKSVSKYFEICYSGKSFADGKDFMSCAFFGTSF